MVESYPLQWPSGVPRNKKPKRSRFDTPPSQTIQNLHYQLRLLHAKNPVISSNMRTYRRGGRDIPYANQTVEDPGVAIYFEYQGTQHCIPCDRWDVVYDNIHAVGKTIEAMRGIERWGTFEMMKATFQGFEQLPPGSDEEYGVEKEEVQYFSDCDSLRELKERYRNLSTAFHPDKGGKNSDMAEINKQYKMKKEELLVVA